jgi:hypothetical protein
MKRPTIKGINTSFVTTPYAAVMGQLLGVGMVSSSVAMSKSEFKAVQKLYGYVPEKPNEKPPPPPLPVRADFKSEWDFTKALENHKLALKDHTKWTDPRPLYQAGADRNTVRHAEADGLRLLAWIAKYVPEGEDPLKTLVQLASEAGFEVDPADAAWANGDEVTEEDSEMDKAV